MSSKAALVALVALVVAACDPVPPAAQAPTPRRPSLALVERAVDLDGAPVGAPTPGQVATVAVVFASWCVHCREEMPVLAELATRHPEVRVLGINYRAHEEYDGRGDAAAVRGFVRDRAPWLRVVPADLAVWASLGAPPKVPTVLVFDREGALVRGFDRRADPIPGVAELEATLATISPD
jgi:thiol-disulfide isomerase/thioredoxin